MILIEWGVTPAYKLSYWVSKLLFSLPCFYRNIKSKVPLWYSDEFPTYEPIASSHPYLSLAPPTSSNTIMIETKDTNKQTCLKLNMGVPILSNPTYSSNAPILEEGVVSFSVLIPATQNPKHVFIGWATPEIVYSPQFFPASLPDVLYIDSVEILTPNGEKAWKVDTKQHTGFMVKLSGLIEGDNQVILEDMRWVWLIYIYIYISYATGYTNTVPPSHTHIHTHTHTHTHTTHNVFQ